MGESYWEMSSMGKFSGGVCSHQVLATAGAHYNLHPVEPGTNLCSGSCILEQEEFSVFHLQKYRKILNLKGLAALNRIEHSKNSKVRQVWLSAAHKLPSLLLHCFGPLGTLVVQRLSDIVLEIVTFLQPLSKEEHDESTQIDDQVPFPP